MNNQEGYLVLENGSVFKGILHGDITSSSGEVVFNTSMVGYEKLITDPSYNGQIIVLTYPLIGNYGINYNQLEADRPWVRGLVVRDLCSPKDGNHYQQEIGLEEYLLENKVLCLSNVDTRAITRILRNSGTMGGIIVNKLDNIDEYIEKAKNAIQPPQGGFVKEVTCKEIYSKGSGSPQIVLMDLGVTKSLIQSLIVRGCEVIVVPADTSAQEILKQEPDGIVLSNGPGDPGNCQYAIENIKKLIGKSPIFGVGMGHQLLSLALGAKVYKLKYGHRGGNHPVRDLRNGRVYITNQNTGYAVMKDSLDLNNIDIIFTHLDDENVEGIRHKKFELTSIQFYPEGVPGHQETSHLLDDFVYICKK